MHWHGLAESPESIVLSSEDYSKFYHTNSHNYDTLRTLFREKKCLIVGFGFKDTFVTSHLASVMQPLSSENCHFAIIGIDPTQSSSCMLIRRKFQQQYKTEVIFYAIDKQDTNPHKNLRAILHEISVRNPSNLTKENLKDRENSISPYITQEENNSFQSYRIDLLEINGRAIHCDPELWLEDENGKLQIWTSTIATSRENYIVHAPREFGLTTLGKQIYSEILTSGLHVEMLDSINIPNYRKKLLSDNRINELSNKEEPTIIIDNFSIIEHRRMLRELSSLFPNIRIILLCNSMASENFLNENLAEIDFRCVSLSSLSRASIRKVIHTLEPDWNSDMCSNAVQRIYDDLLQLCIPLTPSNVIMYASVICKNGDFTPISKLQIVERFIHGALQRPSDAFSESFNYLNKIELISDFCFNLFEKNQSQFNIKEWNEFCSIYKKENLVSFEHRDIISDLISEGVITAETQSIYHFKYKIFFSFFVGRKIASNSALLESCLASDKHLKLEGLVDVLCASVSNCDKILANIEQKLTDSLNKFYQKYPIEDIDVHKGGIWKIKNTEKDTWDIVSKEIECGRASTAELDKLKTSILAERRTNDQNISINDFITSEKTVTQAGYMLRTALESARGVSANTKLSSIDKIIRCYKLAYEVATLFAPIIAKEKYVSWNGFTYINYILEEKKNTQTKKET